MSMPNPKSYWNILRQLGKTNRNSELIPPLKTTTGNNEASETFLFRNKEKADCLNKYFAAVSTVHNHVANLPSFSLKTGSHICSSTISEQEMADKINLLNPNLAGFNMPQSFKTNL